jgi:hypothetical protein
MEKNYWIWGSANGRVEDFALISLHFILFYKFTIYCFYFRTGHYIFYESDDPNDGVAKGNIYLHL